MDRFLNVIQYWCVERVKDSAEFLAGLERPFGETAASAPTAEELRREGEAFVAFASMFGGPAAGRGKLATATATAEEG